MRTSGASLALSNLRAVVILLVLAVHSVLAYLDFLPPSPYRFDEPPSGVATIEGEHAETLSFRGSSNA